MQRPPAFVAYTALNGIALYPYSPVNCGPYSGSSSSDADDYWPHPQTSWNLVMAEYFLGALTFCKLPK
jgi:hypothetical protein